MKILKLGIKAIMTIVAFNANCSYASLSQETQDAFQNAGFKISSITDQPTNSYKQDIENFIQSGLTAHAMHVDQTESSNPLVLKQTSCYFVDDYQKAPGKTVLNYEPPRDQDRKFDTVVISRYNDADQSDHLSAILALWTKMGFSCHAILPRDGSLIFWVDPTRNKGQMVGSFNRHSLEVLIGTDSEQIATDKQINSIKFLQEYLNSKGDSIQSCLCHYEARGPENSGPRGVIVNIDTVRTALGLNKHGKNADIISITLPTEKSTQQK